MTHTMTRNQIESIITDLAKEYIANYGTTDAVALARDYWYVRDEIEQNRDEDACVTLNDYTRWISSTMNDARK